MKRRRHMKEPEAPPTSAFAPVIEAARAMIRGLSSTLAEEPGARDLRLERIAGMETVLVLCQRAAAGHALDPDSAVMGALASIANPREPVATPASSALPPAIALSIEERLMRLEEAVLGCAARPARHTKKVSRILDTSAAPERSLDAVGGVPSWTSAAQEIRDEAVTKARARSAAPDELGRQERALLEVLAQRTKAGLSTSNVQLAILARYSVRSGGFVSALAQLRKLGLASGGTNDNRATSDGIRVAGHVEPLPKGDGLIALWMGRLGGQEATLLRELCLAYPGALEPAELAQKTKYSLKSGGFVSALAKLRSLELVNRGRPIRASLTFFEA